MNEWRHAAAEEKLYRVLKIKSENKYYTMTHIKLELREGGGDLAVSW